MPLANPASAPRLMRLASAFARADAGLVVPVLVTPSAADGAELAQLRRLEAEVTQVAQSQGAEARSVLRIDATPQLGIAHTIAEQQASLLVLGWKGATIRRGARFGGIIDGVLERTQVPTLLSYEGAVPSERILLVVARGLTTPPGQEPLRLAVATARHLRRELDVAVEVVSNADDPTLAALVAERLQVPVVHDPRRRSQIIADRARPSDTVIVPTLRDDLHLRGVATRVLRAVPAGASLLVAIAEARPDATAAPDGATGGAPDGTSA